jgi:flagellar biosynthetic protein FlhB
MSEEDGAGEKTHDPTPQKLEEARRKGDVAKSTDVTSAAAYVGLLLALFAGGGVLLDQGAGSLVHFVAEADRLEGVLLGPGGAGVAGALLGEAALAAAPLFVAPIAGVVIALAAQRAVAASGDKLKPKLSRISPIKNAKEKFGPSGLVNFAKSTVKLGAIAVALVLILRGELGRAIGVVRAEPQIVSGVMIELLMRLLLAATGIAIVIAVIDLAWQQYDHRRRLRMSHQEMRDEIKTSEGDPHVKAQRRRRAEEIATNRMLLDVPGADVVIVNPTHYAIALKWSRAPGSAPVCVAKGVDAVAGRIRERAEAAGVPIHADPACARALHASVDIGREIRPEHYKAVAAAIRFSDRLRRAARDRSAQGLP